MMCGHEQNRFVGRQVLCDFDYFFIQIKESVEKIVQVFEHMTCHFRPGQLCSKVHLIFPAKLGDLIIDITFGLQFYLF